MKRLLTLVPILLVIASVAGVSSAGIWETKCLMCHKEGNTMKAPTKAAMLEKYKTGDDLIKAAKDSENPMMKMQKDNLLNEAAKELYPTQELTGTLQQIQKSGKIKIGYRQSQPPMSFLGKDDIPAGYTIDLCRHIATEIKNKIGRDVTIEYVSVTAEERFDALSDNKIDILCGSTTKTLSRSELVDFTQLTFVTGASFMTLKGKKIRGNFNGKKIGVVKGTTTAHALKELFQETSTDADVVLFNSTAEGLNALRKENIDAFAADQVVLIGLVLTADNPDNFSILPDLFSFEPFALAVRRNDADFRLIADRVISNLYRSKQILKIYDKWFGKFSITRSAAFEALIQLNATPE